MIPLAPLISPCLSIVQEALISGNTNILTTFWQEITAQGTPLIEAIPGDNNHVLVTFLWREQEPLQNILIAGAVVGWDVTENQMSRLLNTDLWYKTYRMRSDTRAIYRFSLNDSLIPWTIDNMEGRLSAAQRDPLNPRMFVFPSNSSDPASTDTSLSVVELPAAPPQPWITPRANVPKGAIETHTITSTLLQNQRQAWIYTPPGYSTSGQPYNLLLLFDGYAYCQFIPTPTILDNLLAAGQLPPFVAVMLDSAPGERNQELLCNLSYVAFLVEELMPWLHEHYHVTSDPQRTIVGGSSAGGLAAAYVGLHASSTFGNVLSQSGSFWWDWDPEEKIAQQWLTQQYALSPQQPLSFYIDVGRLERIPGYDLLLVNRHFRDVLLAKNYNVHFAELGGGHEYLSWRGSFSDGLLALTGKS